jgi:two-component system NtrC family sensor kinase
VMAHPDEGTTMSCDLVSMLREFHAQARLVLPRSIDLVLEVPERVPDVMMNPRGFVHTLWNLTINARQAIQAEGSIAMRCGSDRHQVWVEVADTGCGIPREIQDRIFDPYFTTKPPGQGTGLGLTAVARFARSSNGLVQVESEPGNGATFRLRFPRATVDQPARSA